MDDHRFATHLNSYVHRHGRELAWTSMFAEEDLGFITGEADVALAHQDELPPRYALTIVTPGSDIADQPRTVVEPYDVHVASVFDAHVGDWTVQADVPAAVGDRPGTTSFETLRRRHPELGWMLCDAGDPYVVGGWTLPTVDAALTRWADRHLQIAARFVCDTDRTWQTADERDADAAAARIAAGEHVQVGEDTLVDTVVFDQLLAMPADESAAIIDRWLALNAGLEAPPTDPRDAELATMLDDA